MTISASDNRVQYAGNGVTVAFAFPFRFLADEDLVVILTDADGDDTTLMLTTHYTVSGEGAPGGGTVTMVTAPASGETLTILADPAVAQPVDFVDNGPLPAEVLETGLDRLTLLARRARDLVARTFRLADSDPTPGLVIPAPDVRADKFLAFDGSGNPIAAAGTSADLGPVSAYIDTLLPSANEAALKAAINAEAGVDFAGIATANTFTNTNTFSGVLNANAQLNAAHFLAQNSVRKSGFVSTSSLGTDQNDFAPTGHADASVFIFNLSASINVTGIAGGALGRELWLFNNSTTHNVTLLNENTGSSAANRFTIASAAAKFVIPPQSGVRIWYNGANRWNVHGIPAGRINQVVTAALTAASTATPGAATPADFGLSANITPKSTTSHILMVAIVHGLTSGGPRWFSYFTDGSNNKIGSIGDTAGNRIRAAASAESNMGPITLVADWAPASVAAQTVKVRYQLDSAATFHINRSVSDTDSTAFARGASVLFLIEYEP